MARASDTGDLPRPAPVGAGAAAGDDRGAPAGGRRGGEERFRDLFDRHGEEVYRFFLRKGFPAEDARELTQDTFFRVYQGLEGFRGEATERTWIFSIAHNAYRNTRRHDAAAKRRGTEIPLDEAPPAGGEAAGRAPNLADPSARDPLAATLDHERRELLREAMAGLPDRMRRCVLLRVAQDLKYREIAALLGVSIDTVKSQLHQATERLRSRLGEHFAGLDELERERGGPS